MKIRIQDLLNAGNVEEVLFLKLRRKSSRVKTVHAFIITFVAHAIATKEAD
ncbi:MAG: hypothetical protein ABIH58_02890 [Patescibacteria group bacterium]